MWSTPKESDLPSFLPAAVIFRHSAGNVLRSNPHLIEWYIPIDVSTSQRSPGAQFSKWTLVHSSYQFPPSLCRRIGVLWGGYLRLYGGGKSRSTFCLVKNCLTRLGECELSSWRRQKPFEPKCGRFLLIVWRNLFRIRRQPLGTYSRCTSLSYSKLFRFDVLFSDMAWMEAFTVKNVVFFWRS